MGDRKNPIKFGPEWLRNLARERSAASSSSQNQGNTNTGSAGSGDSGSSGGNCGSPCGVSSTTGGGSAGTAAANSTGATAKIQLAKQRYGREEMLALYDRTSEAPPELKYIDFLYQPRGKPPFALNNTFEDEIETGPPQERFMIGRGATRGAQVPDRGRPKMSFVRTPSAGGRGVHWPSWQFGGGNPRMSFNPDDEPAQRSWGTSNGGGPTIRNSSGDQPDWAPNKLYRSNNKRQGLATNWRQSREEGEEWRSASDAAAAAAQGRPRNNQDKWAERDWGDRPQDKNQNRNNRRTWVGSEMQSNDELPEWAVDNAEACGGTFDASGAFHGYSNDDSNVPKAQEPYPLTRSHTHGSFARSKTMEEGSEEWWASEKAKKLSPKRFDASDVKFKKTTPAMADSKSADSSVQHSIDDDLLDSDEKHESAVPESPDTNIGTPDEDKYKKSAMKPKFSESNTFDSLMRSNINVEEATDDRSNFQSVMITPNNSLRQKHQNIVSSTPETTARIQSHRSPGLMKLLANCAAKNFSEKDYDKINSTTEERIVEDLIDMTLEDKEIIQITKTPTSSSGQMMNPPNSAMAAGMQQSVNSLPQMQNSAMQIRMSSPIHTNQSMMAKSNMPGGLQGPGMQTGMQQVGITNSALNASLGLPIRPLGVATINSPMGIRMQGMPPHMMPNSGMSNPGMPNPGMSNPGMANPGMNNSMGGSGLPAGMGPAAMQSNNSGIPGFQNAGGLASMTSSNMTNNSLFMGQNANNNPMQNHANQPNMFPMHGLQHSGSQASYASMYNNMMQTPPPPPPAAQNQAEMWYYEDPKKTVQGPFSSKEMFNWYRAGFFTQNLMVRRACDTTMRPLGSYGPVVPFAQMDILSSFPMSTNYEPHTQGPRDSILNSQSGLGLESVMNTKDTPPTEQFGAVHVIRKTSFTHAPPPSMVDSLWSPPTPAPDMMWVQQAMNARNDTHVNNLPIYFWDDQPTTIAPSTLLPEDITKEMKTEDQILAQMRAAQNINTQPNMSFLSEPPPTIPVPAKAEDVFIAPEKVTPNLDELQKLLQKDIMSPKSAASEASVQSKEPEETTHPKPEKTVKADPGPEPVKQQQAQKVAESKASKQAKNESEKAKSKEASVKVKAKKTKEDKKEEDVKKEEELAKPEKRSVESSPIKNKKSEEKNNKKELEKEKKEWLKDGFTIVKGPEKSNNKENKKKNDETKANEEAERKKKEEEKLAAEEEKKKKQLEAAKKQQEQQQAQQQRQATESVVKKAPWSAVANQTLQATSKDGLTLAEIQRLEREKKLEQMKEQQQMMQIIAQQQAAALAREQEMQAGLGWAKKKGNNLNNSPGQSLAEIQAEARKQAAAAAAAAVVAQMVEEAPTPAPQPAQAPWGAPHNGAAIGFWDTQPNASPKTSEKTQEPPKVDASKNKKKLTLSTPSKKETSPAAEFDTWCSTVLTSWSSKIDVPTFVGFLKDIESPYEVKDYVKCYLGETKDSSDFARQFLERRSKLLRVGMVTPSDDLCSPAIAVNPRTISGSDYQEVKGKGKKTKKNKMLKVDARILGFSVTAAEDRINVGDIDTV